MSWQAARLAWQPPPTKTHRLSYPLTGSRSASLSIFPRPPLISDILQSEIRGDTEGRWGFSGIRFNFYIALTVFLHWQGKMGTFNSESNKNEEKNQMQGACLWQR